MMSTAADSDADYHNSDGSVMPDVLAKGREACYKVQPSATSLRSSAP
jgi:cytochrome c oxidase assembly factor 6